MRPITGDGSYGLLGVTVHLYLYVTMNRTIGTANAARRTGCIARVAKGEEPNGESAGTLRLLSDGSLKWRRGRGGKNRNGEEDKNEYRSSRWPRDHPNDLRRSGKVPGAPWGSLESSIAVMALPGYTGTCRADRAAMARCRSINSIAPSRALGAITARC